MARFLVRLLTALLVAGAALLLGLAGSTLRTGRIDPLDWLLPGLLALLALLLIERRGVIAGKWSSLAGAWALVALPPLLFVLLAASHAPRGDLLGFAGALALAALVAGWALARSGKLRWSALTVLCLLFAAGRWLISPHDLPPTRSAHLPPVGVVSALPLYGPALAEAGHNDPVRDAGRTSPLWQTLGAHHALKPIDHLDPASLAPFGQLLIAQPRQLAPDELVALDAWVRRGGSALILADPLLHWPDPRPLGHPQRAPLTSLLDPLLAHWGLRLEPDQPATGGDPVVRRLLESGALLQMTGASRFTLTGGSAAACQLDEDGLVVRCMVGKGRVRLVADADWINDTLWTLDPMLPSNASAWTSDAIPALLTWLRPDAPRVDSPGVWLVDQARLITALRAALGLLAALAILHALVVRRPSMSRQEDETKPDHRRNISNTGLDTG